MLRFLFFLIGFGMAIIGFMYIILYLNYLSIGYTYSKYLSFIFTRFECLLAPLGLIIINITILIEKREK